MYADDTVIMAESEKDLQTALDKLNIYCHGKDLLLMLPKQKLCFSQEGKLETTLFPLMELPGRSCRLLLL